MQTRLAFVLLCLVACDDPAKTGQYAVQQVELESLADGVDCGCFWQDYEYPSENACRADNVVLIDAPAERCVIAVGKRYQAFEAGAECRLIAASNKLNCYYTHQATCDSAGFNACDTAFDAANVACDQHDPCRGLSGPDLTDCQLEEAQLASETLDCFGL